MALSREAENHVKKHSRMQKYWMASILDPHKRGEYKRMMSDANLTYVVERQKTKKKNDESSED